MNDAAEADPQTDQEDSWSNLFRGCGGCLLDVALLISIAILLAVMPAYWVLALGVLAFCLFAAVALIAERRSTSGKRLPAPMGTRSTIIALALAAVLWAGLLALAISYTSGTERDTWMLVAAVLITIAVTILTFWDMAQRRRESRE